ncbi:hypothetical protein QLL95_gp0757 [Cotonvirus japonicus]|uniref:Uncharacterized protein n=1 Tax=Cotonvirus japonicus TaxID=2811091 RepID=A0ABM7NTC9_9VIRU|nr:hypothetical protein QLL95_gp0757 [Cotonvirus japonicus]BCS83366.1 hypothetical protein [Cotonvirus japonicus]
MALLYGIHTTTSFYIFVTIIYSFKNLVISLITYIKYLYTKKSTIYPNNELNELNESSECPKDEITKDLKNITDSQIEFIDIEDRKKIANLRLKWLDQSSKTKNIQNIINKKRQRNLLNESNYRGNNHNDQVLQDWLS